MGADGVKKSLVVLGVLLGAAVLAVGLWWAIAGRSGPPEPEVLVDEEATIDEGSFISFEIALDRPAEVGLTVEVLDGPAVDLLLFESAELFERYREALQSADPEKFPYQSVPNVAGVRRVTQSARLGPGQFLLVIDNSFLGGTRPPAGLTGFLRNDAARVKVTVTAVP